MVVVLTVSLVLLPFFGPRPKDVPFWALAWYSRRADGSGVVYVRRPFQVLFFAVQRIAHELAHHDDADHHPWAEFCTRSPYALRFGWGCATRSKLEVQAFLRDGRLP